MFEKLKCGLYHGPGGGNGNPLQWELQGRQRGRYILLWLKEKDGKRGEDWEKSEYGGKLKLTQSDGTHLLSKEGSRKATKDAARGHLDKS